jgi:hypothetical protein
VGDATGLCSGDLGGISELETIPGVGVCMKLGDKSGELERSGLVGLLLERGAIIPSEIFGERPRETPRGGVSDMAFDHSETNRLERCTLWDELES